MQDIPRQDIPRQDIPRQDIPRQDGLRPDIPAERGADGTTEPPPGRGLMAAADRHFQGTDRRLDAETRRRIGRSLRVLYAGLLAQPIPERFEALVAEFAARSEQESAR